MTSKKVTLSKTEEADSASSSTKNFPPLPISNKFNPLSSIYHNKSTQNPLYPRNNQTSITPRPMYSTLAQLPNIPKPSIASSSTNNYHINPNFQVVKILEPYEEQKLNQGFQTLIEYLYPKNYHFYTNDYQTREYYQAILVDTKSVVIEHTYSSTRENYIDCSKVKILKVINPEEWSSKPYTNKVLSCYEQYPVYNYYDYQEAWFKAFLLRSFNHTWFFYFDNNFPKSYPRWFVKWFKYMGTISEVFPQKILQGFSKYKEIFAQEEAPIFEYVLQFSIIFKIPWILLFTYKKQEQQKSSPPLLYREYSVKWWKKIEDRQADENAVYKYHATIAQTKTITKPITNALTVADYIQKIQGCSTQEELQLIINEIRKSPTPSEDLYQDAQDPYDDVKL